MLSAAVFLQKTERTLEMISAGELAEYLENSIESGIDYMLTDNDLRLIIKALRIVANGKVEK